MARQLADGVWQLDLGLVPPLAANAFLVDDGSVTLCDTGLGWNRPSLSAELSAAGYAPADLDRVLLTHYDLDHVGGLDTLDGFDGPVYLGRPDHELATGAGDPPLIHHKGLFHRIARCVTSFPAGIDLRPVDDGDRVGNFTAFLTPGHNPGHTVYVHDDGVALLGDLVWEEDGRLTAPFWLDSYDMAGLRRSIVSLSDRIPAFEIAAMGHGEPLVSGGRVALRELAGEYKTDRE
ncbi:MAG: MBL fold metallo-hydrolase [Haloarculaceae archaeon]